MNHPQMATIVPAGDTPPSSKTFGFSTDASVGFIRRELVPVDADAFPMHRNGMGILLFPDMKSEISLRFGEFYSPSPDAISRYC
jgi:hypothetical protein